MVNQSSICDYGTGCRAPSTQFALCATYFYSAVSEFERTVSVHRDTELSGDEDDPVQSVNRSINEVSALWKWLCAGERSAFETGVSSHYASFYRQLLHLTGNVDTAADLTPETFVKAWKSIRTLAARSAIRTWLHPIAARWQGGAVRVFTVAPLFLDRHFSCARILDLALRLHRST